MGLHLAEVYLHCGSLVYGVVNSGVSRSRFGVKMKEEQRDRITRWTEGARLLRVHVDSPVTDPWRWLDSPAASDSSIFAWEDARSGLRIAAVGELLTWEPEEEQRFEGAADVLGRWSSGLVEDDKLRAKALEDVRRCAKEQGLEILGTHDSQLAGARSGNREIFILARGTSGC